MENKEDIFFERLARYLFLYMTAIITLKLTNVIAWSWCWVLSPLWVPFCFLPIAVCIQCVSDEVLSIKNMLKNRRRND